MKTQKVQFKSSFGLMLYMWIRRLSYAVVLAGAGSVALIAWITNYTIDEFDAFNICISAQK